MRISRRHSRFKSTVHVNLLKFGYASRNDVSLPLKLSEKDCQYDFQFVVCSEMQRNRAVSQTNSQL